MSVSASRKPSMFPIAYSIAALRLNASTSAVSFSAGVFPTLLISSPVCVASVAAPTASSGCSLIPLSIISARCFNAGPNCLVR